MSPTSRDRNFPKNEAHTHTRGQTTQRNWSSKVSAGQNVDPPIVTQYDIRQISASAFQIRNYPPAGSSHLLPFEEDSNGAICNRIPVVKRSGKPSRAPTQAPTLPGDIDTPVTGLNPSSLAPSSPAPDSAKAPAIAADPAESDTAQPPPVEEPIKLHVDRIRTKSPGLSLKGSPDEAPAFPSTPRRGTIASLAPPIATLPLETSPGFSIATTTGDVFSNREPSLGASPVPKIEGLKAENNSPAYCDSRKPTCSLNLVCYRSGAKECELRQIQGILRDRCSSDEAFEAAKMAHPSLISTDHQFFHEMKSMYETEMCGFLRRHLSPKSLQAFQVPVVGLVSTSLIT